MFCSNCGAQIDDDSRFCTVCGHTIASATVNDDVNQQQVDNQQQAISQQLVVSQQPAVSQQTVVSQQPVNAQQPVNDRVVVSNQSVNGQKPVEIEIQEEKLRQLLINGTPKSKNEITIHTVISLIAAVLIVCGMTLPLYSRKGDNLTIKQVEKNVNRLKTVGRVVDTLGEIFGAEGNKDEKSAAESASTKIMILKVIAYGSVIIIVINLFVSASFLCFILGAGGIVFTFLLKSNLKDIFGSISLTTGAYVLIAGFVLELLLEAGGKNKDFKIPNGSSINSAN